MNENGLIIYDENSLKHHVVETLKGIEKKRFVIQQLHDYVTSANDRKVCCLYGLRRTGKTIMMLQEIQDIADYEKCLLIECVRDSTMMQVRQAIESHPQCKYIFIDEITKARNFIDTSSVLANRYASEGIKVVITGTDSLGFFLAKEEELCDRANIIHTTYIPFFEYHYLLGKDIMEYIQYGGTLSPENVFYNHDTLNEYSNSAIVYNIVHSLEKWNQGRRNGILEEIVDRGELPTLISKVIEYHNRLFLSKIINKSFVSHDFGSLIDLLTKNGSINPELMFPSDKPEIRQEMQERIRIALNIKESTFNVDADCINVIIKYLKELDVLYELPNVKKRLPEYLFTQTGMRYCQASDLAYALTTSDSFFLGNQRHYTIAEQQAILEKMKSDICGGILEDIVLYQTSYVLKNHPDKILVSKYEQDVPSKEFDVFITNFSAKQSLIIEVKLSTEQSKNQIRHLTDSEFCQKFEEDTGTTISNKLVIYRGENKFNPFEERESEKQVLYVNVEDFLLHTSEMVEQLLSETVQTEKQMKKLMHRIYCSPKKDSIQKM